MTDRLFLEGVRLAAHIFLISLLHINPFVRIFHSRYSFQLLGGEMGTDLLKEKPVHPWRESLGGGLTTS